MQEKKERQQESKRNEWKNTITSRRLRRISEYAFEWCVCECSIDWVTIEMQAEKNDYIWRNLLPTFSDSSLLLVRARITFKWKKVWAAKKPQRKIVFSIVTLVFLHLRSIIIGQWQFIIFCTHFFSLLSTTHFFVLLFWRSFSSHRLFVAIQRHFCVDFCALLNFFSFPCQ